VEVRELTVPEMTGVLEGTARRMLASAGIPWPVPLHLT